MTNFFSFYMEFAGLIEHIIAYISHTMSISENAEAATK